MLGYTRFALTLIVGWCALMPVAAIAQDKQPIGRAVQTITNEATPLPTAAWNPSADVKATLCVGTVETAAIRHSVVILPTSTTGRPANVGDVLTVSGALSIRAFQAIRSTSTNAAIDWECYR